MAGPQSVTLSGHHVALLSHLGHIPLKPHSSLLSDLEASSALCLGALAHGVSSAWNGLPLPYLPSPKLLALRLKLQVPAEQSVSGNVP